MGKNLHRHLIWTFSQTLMPNSITNLKTFSLAGVKHIAWIQGKIYGYHAIRKLWFSSTQMILSMWMPNLLIVQVNHKIINYHTL
jgi:hypothetical protein